MDHSHISLVYFLRFVFVSVTHDAARCRLGFGAFVKQRRDSDASDSDPVDPVPVILHPSGTKIDVFAGKFKGRMGEIIAYSGVGWYTALIKGFRETCSVRSNQFRAL